MTMASIPIRNLDDDSPTRRTEGAGGDAYDVD